VEAVERFSAVFATAGQADPAALSRPVLTIVRTVWFRVSLQF
jgi:hypothetical protein